MREKKICVFIGHGRFVFCKNLDDELYQILKNLVLNGASEFFIGTHGEFDKLALRVCLKLRDEFSFIKISLVMTSMGYLNKKDDYYINNKIETFMFPIENVYYKNRITKSNEMMIDKADVVVAYVDENITTGGAIKSFKYAKKKNKQIINIYKK